MKHVPVAVTRKIARTSLIVSKNSPTLLFAAGVVGFGATVVLACKATLKVEEILDDHQKKLLDVNTVQHLKYSEGDRRHDKAILYSQTSLKLVKLYAPSIAVASLSVAALTGSHHILSSRNAGLTAAYAAISKGFDEYRARVRDELGDEKDQQFRHGVVTTKSIEQTDKGTKTTGIQTFDPNGISIYARVFDQLNDNWNTIPEYNRIFLDGVQRYMNDRLHARGHLFLNEVYDALGLDRSKAGGTVGWFLGKGDDFVDFGMYNRNTMEARDFINGREASILLDFNVAGPILNLLDES